HRRCPVGPFVPARRHRRHCGRELAAGDVRVEAELLRCDAREAALGRAVGQGSAQGRQVMLRHLRVTNFAILSDVAIEFGEGMNVLTGETGAGKSLIVEAVNLLRGGRASADIPRAGADEAVVEAIVEVPQDLAAHVASVVEGAGLPAAGGAPARELAKGEPNEVFIRRVIQRGGRSRAYVNGALTTVSRPSGPRGRGCDPAGQP